MLSSTSYGGDVQAITEKVQSSSVFLKPLLQNIGQVIVGQREMVDRVLIGLLTGGHILMEGVPGLAKTLTVRTIAELMKAQFQRIQLS